MAAGRTHIIHAMVPTAAAAGLAPGSVATAAASAAVNPLPAAWANRPTTTDMSQPLSRMRAI